MLCSVCCYHDVIAHINPSKADLFIFYIHVIVSYLLFARTAVGKCFGHIAEKNVKQMDQRFGKC